MSNFLFLCWAPGNLNSIKRLYLHPPALLPASGWNKDMEKNQKGKRIITAHNNSSFDPLVLLRRDPHLRPQHSVAAFSLMGTSKLWKNTKSWLKSVLLISRGGFSVSWKHFLYFLYKQVSHDQLTSSENGVLRFDELDGMFYLFFFTFLAMEKYNNHSWVQTYSNKQKQK